jgi:Xaa-Pro aminopeptidase
MRDTDKKKAPFSAGMYGERRKRLAEFVKSGVILFLGNEESPRNYRDNVYPFRQDSSFLYFWGLNSPGLAAVIDVEEGLEAVYGNDLTFEEMIFFGRQSSFRDAAAEKGIQHIYPFDRLETVINKTLQNKRPLHFLPQYQAGNILKLQKLLNVHPEDGRRQPSLAFIRGVIEQRSVKTLQEISEIEKALAVTHEMHMRAMKMTKPGVCECEVAGVMENVAYVHGGCRMAYPPIFSVEGEILHNQSHANRMKPGELAVNDAGAESPRLYASDITRTLPVSGRFSNRQKEIYGVVLNTQEAAIQAMRPGIEFKKIHLLACRVMTEGLQRIGLMKGDGEASVAAGAHALFFPHGLGHMLGLDVHDMEGLGENHVGYGEHISRSNQFGMSSLRLARALEPGFVVTVEPGIYFISDLIDRWRAEKKFEAFINYEKSESYKGFGGIRIEDDVLVTENGCSVLGKPIPKSIDEVETFSS